MSIGAPMKTVSFNGREYKCLGDGAGALKQGGYDAERTPNGDGATSRNILTPVNGSVSDQGIEIKIDSDDLAYLIDLKNSGDLNIAVVWTYFGDISYSASCSINGELNYDPMTASTQISWAWDGVADKL